MYTKPQLVNGLNGLEQPLYLENGVSESYEVRLSESKVYELKFGNDINGKQLKSGDKVSVFYLQTDGSIGEIGQNVFLGRKLKDDDQL